MLALELRFLTGRYAATRYNDREHAEWPPHPARVYSALVAALHDDPTPAENERSALDWLASVGPPEILAPEAGFRRQREVYVPTNDPAALANIDATIETLTAAEAAVADATGKERAKAEKTLKKAQDALVKRSLKSAKADGKGTPSNAAALLEGRSRQPRTFPVALPHKDVVVMRWPVEAPEGVAEALDGVAARVARLGHSSSLVSVRVIDGESDVNGDDLKHWEPSDDGDEMLRVATSGQLARLEDAHALHRQVEPRVLPAGYVAYATRDRDAKNPLATTPGTVFAHDGWWIFRVVPPPGGGRRALLHLSMAQEVARAMRGTLHKAVDGDWPEELLGHAPGGGPTEKPHLAIVPLSDVDHPHASGSILGVALVPPAGLATDARNRLLKAVGIAEQRAAGDLEGHSDPPALKLTLGRAGCLYLQRLREAVPTKTLQSSRWTGPARRWSSVTAIALDRNPGNLRSRDPDVVGRAIAKAEETIAAGCVNIGLPEPQAVWVHRRAVIDGAPAARRFMPYPSDDHGPRRVCVHAELLFARPVKGPLLLGAGRHLGIGLCAPYGGHR